MGWPTNPRPARSLTTLFTEVNTRFPNRSKASDGLIGDPSHQSRESDHNAWVRDGNVGVVTAADITDGSAPGVPEIADLIVRTLVDRRDKRVKYIIHESRIIRSYDKPGIPKWTWAPYTGLNGHFSHAHVSVWDDKNLYDSTAPWGLLIEKPETPMPETSLRSRDFAIFGLVNMHAPDEDDKARMRHCLRRGDHLDFTVTAYQEFNGPMAEVVRNAEKMGLHRAEPNSGTSGNAFSWREPVWRGTPLPDLDVKIPGRWLHMAAVMFEHTRTGFLVPALSLHNPPSEGKAAEPQWVRNLCIERELAWARRMRREVGRAVLLGDWNEAEAIKGRVKFERIMAHKVDEGYATGDIETRKSSTHYGFVKSGITDHAATSVPVNVKGRTAR